MVNSPVSLLGSGMAGGAQSAVAEVGCSPPGHKVSLEKAMLCKPLWWALSHD